MVQSSVTAMNLSNNHLSAAGAMTLGKALSRNNTLRILLLDGNAIGDSGVDTLAPALSANASLLALSLANNNISWTVRRYCFRRRGEIGDL